VEAARIALASKEVGRQASTSLVPNLRSTLRSAVRGRNSQPGSQLCLRTSYQLPILLVSNHRG